MEHEAYARITAHRVAFIFLEKMMVETGAIPKDSIANLLDKFSADIVATGPGALVVIEEQRDCKNAEIGNPAIVDANRH